MKAQLNGRVMPRPDFARDELWCQLVTRWFRTWPAPAEDYDGDFEPFVIDEFLSCSPWTIWVSKRAILAVEQARVPRRQLSPWESAHIGTIARLVERVGPNFEVSASQLEVRAWLEERFEFQGRTLDASYWRFMTVMRLLQQGTPGASDRLGASWIDIGPQKCMGIDGDSFRLILPVASFNVARLSNVGNMHFRGPT